MANRFAGLRWIAAICAGFLGRQLGSAAAFYSAHAVGYHIPGDLDGERTGITPYVAQLRKGQDAASFALFVGPIVALVTVAVAEKKLSGIAATVLGVVVGVVAAGIMGLVYGAI